MSSGEWPENGQYGDKDSFYLPSGVIFDRNLSEVVPFDQMEVREEVTSSWYEYSGGDDQPLHPWDGETTPRYTGPEPPWEYLQDYDKYTWMKAPRYQGRATEVGPLARMLVAYASGHDDVQGLVNDTLGGLGVGAEALFSTLGRTAARGIETVLIARKMEDWFENLIARVSAGNVQTFNGELWEPDSWPSPARGYGMLEAARGTLGHWVQIENGAIRHYQAVVPSTWNCSPRDAAGANGPYEAALMDNHPLVDPERPIEILRTIHSFDPCMACGAHVLDATGNEVVRVRVQ
jgi:[NiFe] hydrogenase large subunit/hydrogenase large subunit